MDVFGLALRDGSNFLVEAAVAAAAELGLFTLLTDARPRTDHEIAEQLRVLPALHRLRKLLDVLAASGGLLRRGESYVLAQTPIVRALPVREGWGQLAEVIRNNRPLSVDGEEARQRFHRHLQSAGAAAASELAPLLGPGPLLDLGGGIGAYTAAFLRAHATASATICDFAEVLHLAKNELAPFDPRVRFVAGDARCAAVGGGYGTALLANLLHLHPPAICAELCAAAVAAVDCDGLVVIKDLALAADRSGPLSGLLFALNMAIYTDGGDVYDSDRLAEFLRRAGLVSIEVRHLQSAPDAVVVSGRKPRSA